MKNYFRQSVCLAAVLCQCLAPVFAQVQGPAAAAVESPVALPNPIVPAITVNLDGVAPGTTALVTRQDAADTPLGTTTATVSAVSLPLAPAGKITVRVPVEISFSTPSGQRYPDSVLRVVERTHTGAAVGLMVVGLFLGAGFLPPSKENNRGSHIDEVPHPFFPGMDVKVGEWATINKPNSTFKNPLLIRPDVFLLVYTDLTSDKVTFDLLAETTVSRKPDSGGWLTAPSSISCRNNFSEDHLTLEQWKADGYAEVKRRMVQHRDECISSVVAALPVLLKD